MRTARRTTTRTACTASRTRARPSSPVPLIALAIPSVIIGFAHRRRRRCSAATSATRSSCSSSNDVLGEIGAASSTARWPSRCTACTQPPFWLALAGVLTAWVFFLKKPQLAGRHRRARSAALRAVLVNKYYFDWFNENVLAAGSRLLGSGLLEAAATWRSSTARWSTARRAAIGWFGGVVRRVQSGFLYSYAFWMIIGLAVLLGWFLMRDQARTEHMQGSGLLSLLIWLPIAGGRRRARCSATSGIGAGALGRARRRRSLTFVALDPAVAGFDTRHRGLPVRREAAVDPGASLRTTHLGVDGISLPLILLTTFITIPVIIAAWTVIEQRPAQYFAAFLIMEGLMIGVFCALDALLFYFFWEAMLIPMFLIIGIWGGPRRVYATIKFFLYTFLGSVFMLVALIYMYVQGRRLLDRGVPGAAADADRAALDLLRLPAGLRGEGADVAGAHVVAGCARRSAHRRLGDPGRHHAEDGRLRLPALQPADHAGCEPRARLADDRAVADRRGLHRLRRARAAGHEEADRVFVHRAHGLRDARRVHRVRHRRATPAACRARAWASTARWCR